MVFKYLAVGLLLCHACTGNAEEKPAYHLGYRDFYDGRIVNGHNAKEGQFPHQILIFQSYIVGYKKLLCGGSIINSEWVLTAAHCVVKYYTPGGRYRVAAGKHVLQKIEESEQVSNVALAFVHEDYDQGTGLASDIALLKLETPLQLNERVAPVTLPKQDVIHNGTVTLSGWGATNSFTPIVLQTVDIPLVQYDECKASLDLLSNRPLEPSNVCTGPLGGNIAACFGDSGGPLVQYTEDNRVEQVGIVSWGVIPCGGKGAPTVYTRVSYFVDWIENIISNN